MTLRIRIPLLLTFLLSTFACFAQIELEEIPHLGYVPGTQFTYHHNIVDYAKHTAANSDRASLISYGHTYEGRELVVLVITDPSNHAKLEEIRASHVNKTGLTQGNTTEPSLPVVWLNYNIHGDEASASEAALATIHHLTTDQSETTKNYLKEMIIIIDPCVNPDGREHYVTWYKTSRGKTPTSNPDALEHHNPWSSGRQNHYLMDLNRDWAWQTQIENQQRLAVYKQWMPMVHCDFHEMGVNEDYFFAPAAEPLHKDITPWQIKFQNAVGAGHADRFNEYGWLYFTGSDYDLFYPSYGDTWPIFNGAVGFTYEQGGSRTAGLTVKRANGHILTLSERVQHHLTTGLSTIFTSYEKREKLTSEFYKYFEKNTTNPPGEWMTYIIKLESEQDKHPVAKLTEMLARQQITFGSVEKGRTAKGFSYKDNQNRTFTLDENDLVISCKQPLGTLIKVLFEPEAVLEDSLTYDATAWALPYAYNLEAYAVREAIVPTKKFAFSALPETVSLEGEVPFGYVCSWSDPRHAQFLSAALAAEIKVRATPQPLVIDGRTYERGSLLFITGDQTKTPESFRQTLRDLSQGKGALEAVSLGSIKGAKTDNGIDLGHYSIQSIDQPKIALLSGKGVSQTGFGELWYFFDQELECPVSVLSTDYLSRIDLTKYDVIVLPGGNYSSNSTKLLKFAEQGGTIIAIDGAVTGFASHAGGEGTPPQTALNAAIAAKAENDADGDGPPTPAKYGDSERRYLSGSAAGSIYRADLDETHPLSFGVGASVFLMKRNSEVYPFLLDGSGWTVGRFNADADISGFIGAHLKEDLKNSMAFGSEDYGDGKIVYFPDSPVFRIFWHGGKMLLCNAVFMTDF